MAKKVDPFTSQVLAFEAAVVSAVPKIFGWTPKIQRVQNCKRIQKRVGDATYIQRLMNPSPSLKIGDVVYIELQCWEWKPASSMRVVFKASPYDYRGRRKKIDTRSYGWKYSEWRTLDELSSNLRSLKNKWVECRDHEIRESKNLEMCTLALSILQDHGVSAEYAYDTDIELHGPLLDYTTFDLVRLLGKKGASYIEELRHLYLAFEDIRFRYGEGEGTLSALEKKEEA